MIERIKTITYEVRSHRHRTILGDNGQILIVEGLLMSASSWKQGYIKRFILHLQDVLKCMRQIEKEKQANEEKT